MNIEAIRIEVAKLEMKPGDMLLFRNKPPERWDGDPIPRALKTEQIRSIAAGIRQAYPGIPFLIVPAELEVSVVENRVICKNNSGAPLEYYGEVPAGMAFDMKDAAG